MNITIYDVFELNRVLHILLSQQQSYIIQTAFKIHNLIKWLDETEKFVLERMRMVLGTGEIDTENPLHTAFLSSQIPFTNTDLTVDDILNTTDDVKINVQDAEILEKLLPKG